MKKKLIAIGYWNSKFYGEDKFIWPQELVRDSIGSDMQKLAGYIANGKSAIAWAGYAGCRICDETLGTQCLTDGFYIWPEKLEHYILEHKIFLPDEFINHAKNNKWKVKKTNYSGSYIGEIDRDFWIGWCKNNRNPDLEPKFNYKEYSIPKETGKGKLTYRLLSELFRTIEDLDVVVEKIEMDGRDLPKEAYEEYDGKGHFWSAKVERQFPLITVVGADNIASSSLVFKNGKPIIYCEQKASMYGKFNFPTRFCPDLDLRNNRDINKDSINVAT
jgi:hypothetical protein